MLTPDQLLLTLGIKLADLYEEEVIPQGTHPITGTVSFGFSGAIEQLAGVMAAPNLTLPLPMVLAILAEAGVKADVMTQAITKAVALAAKEKTPVSEQIEVWSGAIKEARALVLSKLPKVPKKGALKPVIAISDILVEGTGLELVTVPPKKARRKSA